MTFQLNSRSIEMRTCVTSRLSVVVRRKLMKIKTLPPYLTESNKVLVVSRWDTSWKFVVWAGNSTTALFWQLQLYCHMLLLCFSQRKSTMAHKAREIKSEIQIKCNTFHKSYEMKTELWTQQTEARSSDQTRFETHKLKAGSFSLLHQRVSYTDLQLPSALHSFCKHTVIFHEGQKWIYLKISAVTATKVTKTNSHLL